MASEWTGFTDEELRQLGNGQEDSRRKASAHPKSQVTKPKSRPQRVVPPMKKLSAPSEPIEPSARLAAPRLITVRPTDQPAPTNNAAANVTPTSSNPFLEEPGKPNPNEAKYTDDQAKHEINNPKIKDSELLSDADGINRDMSNLEQYQQQQKMMEELNKQKKRMLTTALAARQKAASKEATKLKTLHAELSKLDQSLNVDVSVIRDRIELATRDYAEASKRYNAGEQEYIAAKINLHKKSEQKEQLTEHLYAIIQQNELRKAKKLAELMQQLELVPEDSPDGQNNLQLPSLSLLGNIQTVASGNLKQITSPTSPEAINSELNNGNIKPPLLESEIKTESVTGINKSEATVSNQMSEVPVVPESPESAVVMSS